MKKPKRLNQNSIKNILIVNVHSSQNAGDYALLIQTIYYLKETFGNMAGRLGHEQAFGDGGGKAEDNNSETVVEPDHGVESLGEAIAVAFLNDFPVSEKPDLLVQFF